MLSENEGIPTQIKGGQGDFMAKTIERVNFNTPKIPKVLNVAAYARVSSGKDAMLHSLEAQVRYYS